LAGGADLKAIQAMLGRASIILTADTYTSVPPDLARTTAKRSPPRSWMQPAHLAASPRPHTPTT
jgi:site-specific recombinase XerD